MWIDCDTIVIQFGIAVVITNQVVAQVDGANLCSKQIPKSQ